jgi:gamma-glutamyltranspeptidase / glutathione hydrolase
VFKHAAVAADHELASKAGVEVLRAGGNAVDAAVAASFTLSVVRPYSCGIGGGGFMVLHLPADERRHVKGPVTTAIDYRETGPTGVLEDSFEKIADPNASTHGGKAICVPGTVAGLLLALEKYGTMTRDKVLAPAIRAAESGFRADAHYVNVAAKESLEWLRVHDPMMHRFPFLWDRMLHNGAVAVGDVVVLHEQADALRLIAERGRGGFYEGDVARAIVETSSHAGGWLTADDMGNYKAREMEPFQCELGSSRVLTMPLPSSGGIVLAQVFAMLGTRQADLAAAVKAGSDSPEFIHLIAECCKHAFADRARWLGDPAFVDVPIAKLLDPKYLAERAATVDLGKTFPQEHYGLTDEPQAGGTSHLSVVDEMGGAVSCTETINLYFGSCVAVEKFGFFLNNEMDDFQARTGHANAFGLKHASKNRPRAGKRPLSCMTPTIVLGGSEIDHRPLVLAGASGGPRIISGTMQAILNVVLFNYSASTAVRAPRFHHQWQPDVLQLEPHLFSPRLRQTLQARSHTTERKDAIGAVQLIRAAKLSGPESGGWQAASDPRKGGVADGF